MHWLVRAWRSAQRSGRAAKAARAGREFADSLSAGLGLTFGALAAAFCLLTQPGWGEAAAWVFGAVSLGAGTGAGFGLAAGAAIGAWYPEPEGGAAEWEQREAVPPGPEPAGADPRPGGPTSP